MKRILALTVALAVVGGLAVSLPAQGQDVAGIMGEGFEWDFSIDIGQLFFREDLTETTLVGGVIDHEWRDHEDFDSFFTRVNFKAGNYDYEGVEAGLNFNLFGTEDQTTVLDEVYVPYVGGVPFEPGIVYYRSYIPMDIHGLEILPEVGYGGEIAADLHWAALLGYGYRRVELERAGWNGDMDYDIHWINFKGRILWDVPDVDGLSVLVEPTIGPVFASKRTDDWQAADYTIRGDGGVMFTIRGQAKYDVKDNVRILAGVFYDLQYLNGGDWQVELAS